MLPLNTFLFPFNFGLLLKPFPKSLPIASQNAHFLLKFLNNLGNDVRIVTLLNIVPGRIDVGHSLAINLFQVGGNQIGEIHAGEAMVMQLLSRNA